MATGLQIVTRALKKAGILGVGRAPSSADSNDALDDLNDLLAQWTTDRLMTWGLVDFGLVSTGAATYTVGPGGNFNMTRRPDRIEAAYQKQLVSSPGLNINTPLKVIPAYEDYSRISIPQLVSYGRSVFLDSSYPLGILHPYPVQNANQFEIHIIVKNILPVVTLATQIIVPPHYNIAMILTLARILRQGYGKGFKPDPELNRLQATAVNTVRQSNIQIPELVMPVVLTAGTSGYNIYSDGYGAGD